MGPIFEFKKEFILKILVVSDTHGRLTKMEDLVKSYKDLDLIVHLGDHFKDARAVAGLTQTPIIAVHGNCDGWGLSQDRDYKVVETPGGRILLTHGHGYDVKRGVDRLLYKAEEEGAKAVLFGHTHQSYLEEIDGIFLMNPGSLEEPRGMEPGSYGLVRADKDGISGSILYYKKKKHPGGFLKGLMNYSDRF